MTSNTSSFLYTIKLVYFLPYLQQCKTKSTTMCQRSLFVYFPLVFQAFFLPINMMELSNQVKIAHELFCRPLNVIVCTFYSFLFLND